jgi:ribose-phosphate pyrophosphokinase
MVDDDSYPSPAFSAYGGGPGLAQRSRGLSSLDEADVPMDALAHSTTFSIASSSLRQPHPSVGGGDGDTSAVQRALGGSIDAAASDEEEEAGLRDPGVETTVTLVGDVRDRPVFVVDDICDRPASWIAAAETVVRRGGATKVFCMATHGVFTEDALAELLACESIDRVVVTSSFPIEAQHEKLVVLDVAPLLSEAIRRFHHGENIGQLYSLFAD